MHASAFTDAYVFLDDIANRSEWDTVRPTLRSWSRSELTSEVVEGMSGGSSNATAICVQTLCKSCRNVSDCVVAPTTR
jgi:hypothetical protein